jgi:hypothetical protein
MADGVARVYTGIVGQPITECRPTLPSCDLAHRPVAQDAGNFCIGQEYAIDLLLHQRASDVARRCCGAGAATPLQLRRHDGLKVRRQLSMRSAVLRQRRRMAGLHPLRQARMVFVLPTQKVALRPHGKRQCQRTHPLNSRPTRQGGNQTARHGPALRLESIHTLL